MAGDLHLCAGMRGDHDRRYGALCSRIGGGRGPSAANGACTAFEARHHLFAFRDRPGTGPSAQRACVSEREGAHALPPGVSTRTRHTPCMRARACAPACPLTHAPTHELSCHAQAWRRCQVWRHTVDIGKYRASPAFARRYRRCHAVSSSPSRSFPPLPPFLPLSLCLALSFSLSLPIHVRTRARAARTHTHTYAHTQHCAAGASKIRRGTKAIMATAHLRGLQREAALGGGKSRR